MATLKSLFGYFWAALCMVIVLATFFGLGVWPGLLANTTGVRVSPWWSGGDVSHEINHGSYKTLVRKPVFDGLLSQRSEGFVQIDWVPPENSSLPDVLEESPDVDGDGTPDCKIRIELQTGAVRLTPMKEWVLHAEKLVAADRERILRIRLLNH